MGETYLRRRRRLSRRQALEIRATRINPDVVKSQIEGNVIQIATHAQRRVEVQPVNGHQPRLGELSNPYIPRSAGALTFSGVSGTERRPAPVASNVAFEIVDYTTAADGSPAPQGFSAGRSISLQQCHRKEDCGGRVARSVSALVRRKAIVPGTKQAREQKNGRK
jgi:hypothetical protein